jgi:hypothetical protein
MHVSPTAVTALEKNKSSFRIKTEIFDYIAGFGILENTSGRQGDDTVIAILAVSLTALPVSAVFGLERLFVPYMSECTQIAADFKNDASAPPSVSA